MSRLRGFANTARELSDNPLGIIALFLVLVYGIAALVVGYGAKQLTRIERLPLVYFLVGFPCAVLGVFAWLVSKYPNNLYAPSDFENERNFVRMQLKAAKSLALAESYWKEDGSTSTAAIESSFSALESGALDASQVNPETARILWVDDQQSNNVREREAFESMGVQFDLPETTEGALRRLEENSYSAVISDMSRGSDPRAGYTLLEKMRNEGDETPYFIYTSTARDEHRQSTRDRGGQGQTNQPNELFCMVLEALQK